MKHRFKVGVVFHDCVWHSARARPVAVAVGAIEAKPGQATSDLLPVRLNHRIRVPVFSSQ